MTIWKYELPTHPSEPLRLPANAKFLSVQEQNNRPVMWFAIETKEPTDDRYFLLAVTGGYLPTNYKSYLGTFQLNHGTFVGHLFEL